jgi:hypothetical protein
MKSTPAIRPDRHGLRLALGSIAIGLLSSCGGGGGGASDLKVKSTIFGFDPFTGGFDASGQQGEAPLIPVNMSVVFDFTTNLVPSSCSAASITVQEIDTSVDPPAPGPLAAVTFQVIGPRLIISPLITFSNTNVSYGFNPDTTYQILFQVPPSTSVVRSTEGRTILASDRGPYRFRTSAVVFDQVPGAPVPTMRLLNHLTGAQLSTTSTPFKPAPDVEITFDELVLPPTVVDSGGAGTSPSIRVQLDSDGDVLTTNDRTTLPGTFSLDQGNNSATVLWVSALSEIPTDQPNGVLYVVTVDGTVQDLSGNSKITETNDPGANDVFPFTTIPGSSTTAADPLVETFDNQDREDDSVTSAVWGGAAFPGFLTGGVGGGTGKDGVFDPNDAGFQAAPPTDVTVNVPLQQVTLGTVSSLIPGTPRVYEFTSFIVPLGWTALATGKYPLQIQCSGNVTIDGTIDLSGAAGAVYTTGQIAGGAAGAANFGGGAGSTGGSVVDAGGVDNFFPGKGGATTTYPQLAFTVPGGGVLNQGVSGRNTALTSFTLTDSFFTTQLNALTSTKLWIQPNVAADDFRFERWHPAFRVTGIAAGVVTVQSDPASPDYRGPFDQETSNPYIESDGNGGLRAPLLGQQFDPYVVGELNSSTASNLFDLDLDGTSDDFAFYRGGNGSEAQAVMQTFLTIGRSGGGGGGGGVTAGSNGEDDPTIANGPGAFGGTGTRGGAGGAASPTANFLQKLDADSFRVSTNLFDDGTGNPDQRYVGHLVNPNTSQGNTFTIVSVDALDTVTIQPIVTSGGETINLNTTTLTVGHVVRVTLPYVAGGIGGGGAGVHCAGTSKNPAGHKGHPPLVDLDGDTNLDNKAGSRAGFYDDDGPDTATQDGKEDTSESIFTLPKWIPGGGGGAGGGALRILTAGNLSVSNSGQVLIEGGEGGRSDVAGSGAASGGGGGAGGSIFMGAGGTVTVSAGGLLSTAGGPGGAQGFGLAGGNGASGRIRLENSLGNLSLVNFAGVTTPTLTAENLGKFAGGGSSLAQSIFIASGVLKPLYNKITITMHVVEDGVTLPAATYIVNRDGTIDPASTFTVPPFDFSLSYTISDPATGQPDLGSQTAFTDPVLDPLSAHDGQAFIRFKMILPDTSAGFVLGGKTYTDLRIDTVQIDLDGGKP